MRRMTSACGIAVVACALLLAAGAAGAQGGPGRSGGRGGGTGGSTSGKGRIVAILPDGTLRDLCTSFTQVTESPFVLREGGTEIAAGEVSASGARLDTVRSRSVDVGGLGFTRGLPHRWAFGVSLDAWSGLSLTTGPVSGERDPGGFGGGSLSARHTLFGVDSAGVAFGLVATLTLPGSALSPRATAYGAALSLPFSALLPFEFTLGAMTQIASLADAAGDGRHLRFVDSAKLDRELAPHLSAWLELVSIEDREPGYAALATVNAGLAADLGRHVAVSFGLAAGRAHHATDHGYFGGLGIHG